MTKLDEPGRDRPSRHSIQPSPDEVLRERAWSRERDRSRLKDLLWQSMESWNTITKGSGTINDCCMASVSTASDAVCSASYISQKWSRPNNRAGRARCFVVIARDTAKYAKNDRGAKACTAFRHCDSYRDEDRRRFGCEHPARTAWPTARGSSASWIPTCAQKRGMRRSCFKGNQSPLGCFGRRGKLRNAEDLLKARGVSTVERQRCWRDGLTSTQAPRYETSDHFATSRFLSTSTALA
jgi:hypothetical protein